MYFFIDHNMDRMPFDPTFLENHDSCGIEILRPASMWFYVGQKNVTLGDLRKWFTEEAILALEVDGFIKKKNNLFGL